MRRPAAAPKPRARGGGMTTREWYRPLPPYKEVSGRMRNNTNYMETGVLSAPGTDREFRPDRARELLSARAAIPSSRARRKRPSATCFPAGPAGHDARGIHRQYSAPAGHRSGPRHRGSEAEGRNFPRRLVGGQAQPALRAPGQDPARKAAVSPTPTCAPTTTPPGPWG